MPFQIVQILYWLVLASWLGGMVFMALAAPVVFAVLRRMNVRVPGYTSMELNEEHPTIAAGEVVGGLLARLAQIQLICAGTLLPLIIAQFLLADLSGPGVAMGVIRLALWAVAVGLLYYEWRIHYPRTWSLRQQYLEHVDTPEKADPAREAFEKEQRRSELVYQATVMVLIGMVMFSAGLMPRGRAVAPAPMPPMSTDRQ